MWRKKELRGTTHWAVGEDSAKSIIRHERRAQRNSDKTKIKKKIFGSKCSEGTSENDQVGKKGGNKHLFRYKSGYTSRRVEKKKNESNAKKKTHRRRGGGEKGGND